MVTEEKAADESAEWPSRGRRKTGANGSAQRHDGGAPTAGFTGDVLIGGDKISSGQDCPHHLALHADASAVDDPERLVAQAARFRKVLLHRFFHVPRRNAVEIEHIADGNAYRVGLRIHVRLQCPRDCLRSAPPKNQRPGRLQAAGPQNRFAT